jgi:methyl-accepting chemotaxis protein
MRPEGATGGTEMSKSYSLGTKLVGGFVAVSLVGCLVGLFGYRGMAAGKKGQDEVASSILPAVDALWRASKAIADLRRSELIVVTPGTAADELTKQKASMKGYFEALDAGMKVYEPMPKDKDEEAMWGEYKGALAAWRREHEKVVSLMERGEQAEAFRVAYGSSRTPFRQATEQLAKIVDFEMKQAVAADAEFDKVFRFDMTVMVAMAVGGLALSLALGIFLATTVSRSLSRAIDGLSDGAEQVASAAGQLSASSQGLAEGSSEQAASLEETASAMEEMSAMTRRNSESAGEAKSLSDRAAHSVGKANDSMGQLVGRMAEISATSEEIGKIIKTIDEIAFQTNLLALNAAVEAARAGEAGAGFAVVADEVRNLAQRAAGAAKNTSDLIERTIRQIQDGTSLVERTEVDFREVTGAVAKVNELVSEVSAASTEQSRGIAEVGGAVTQMDKVVQQNAASAEEVASAAEEMNAQTFSMQEIVAGLRVLVTGDRAAGGLRPAAGKARAKSGPDRPRAAVRMASPVGAVRSIAKKRRGGSPAVDPESVFPLEDDGGITAF